MSDEDFSTDLSFSLPEEYSSEKRRASVRVRPMGMRVRLTGRDEVSFFEVDDISAGGLHMKSPARLFAAGQNIVLDIFVLDRCCIGALKAYQSTHAKYGQRGLRFFFFRRKRQ